MSNWRRVLTDPIVWVCIATGLVGGGFMLMEGDDFLFVIAFGALIGRLSVICEEDDT